MYSGIDEEYTEDDVNAVLLDDSIGCVPIEMWWYVFFEKGQPCSFLDTPDMFAQTLADRIRRESFERTNKINEFSAT